MQPESDCEVCSGTGWIYYDVPMNDPRFGKIYPCACVGRDTLPAFKESGLRKEDLDRKWGDLYDLGNTMEAVDVVKNVLEKGYGWVYIWGEYGLAKTVILKTAIAQWFNDHGMGCAYVNMSQLMDHVRASYDQDQSQQEVINRLSYWGRLHLLAIDEMDKVKKTEFVKDKQFTILNERYERAIYKKSITLMASNSPPSHLGGYIHSRIRDNRFEIVELDGADARTGMDWTDI